MGNIKVTSKSVLDAQIGVSSKPVPGVALQFVLLGKVQDEIAREVRSDWFWIGTDTMRVLIDRLTNALHMAEAEKRSQSK